MNNEIIEVKRDDLRELYQVLTNYPAISKEQVQNEMHKVFGKETFKPKSIMERIKTFEDAAKLVGIEDPEEWEENYSNVEPDILAYFKLRIICKALNEGWEPKFTKNEPRWYPWFWLYTDKELKEMYTDEKLSRNMMSTNGYVSEYAGFGYANSYNAPSNTNADIGSRLCLKNSELATYCGKQFIQLWADFYLIQKH